VGLRWPSSNTNAMSAALRTAAGIKRAAITQLVGEGLSPAHLTQTRLVIGFALVPVRRAPVWLLVLLVSGASLGLTPSVARVRGARNCDVRVRPRVSLNHAMSRHGPGTTYCLARGTFRVSSTIETDNGDRVIGAGRNATFIDGSGLPQTAEAIFLANTKTYFADFDISGAPTPQAGSGVYCDDRSNCGKAFSIRGSSLAVQSVDCHDNGGNCIGGGGSISITVDDLDCWNNGNDYSMTPEFVYAACIKRAAVYSTPGNTTVTNSFIHDNPWVGIWCDHCKYGLFRVEGNRFVNNGLTGIEWEMSGGWTTDDQAVIRNNLFRGNNALAASYSAGMHVSTANDITISGNRFRDNVVAGISIIFAESRNPPQPDSRGVAVRNNRMHGDLVGGCDLPRVTCRNNG
jgi:Right handed beta helix region